MEIILWFFIFIWVAVGVGAISRDDFPTLLISVIFVLLNLLGIIGWL